MYGLRTLEYDSEGLPIEDPSNTTYGSVSGGTYPPSPAKTPTQWLNANGTMVALGGGALLLLLLVAKAGR